MMVLVDSGNSRIKLGWLDRASGVREAAPLALEHDQVASLRHWLKTLPRAPRVVVGANVAGEAAASRIQAALGLPVHWVRACACEGGVRNGYTTPGQLGADRWMALIGLVESVPSPPPDAPLVFAHYGTATTIDTLSPQGDDGVRDFIGGVIVPGVSLMRSSLAQHTAQLPLAQGQATRFARNTDQGIVSGVCAAQAGALVQQWRSTFTHFGRVPVLYVSGGGWDTVARTVQDTLAQAPPVAQALHVLASPVLDGLARMHAR